ncbi:hypothetical protein OEZ86_010104 [Tetradesmus obliquus]|uniref:FAS1 domain-containing protein n=1 Tax=Tetradesmus obliquus TaxID=3088 RepID=A0ABY8UP58_TETOB|nr:hypothetical protein OEZ85_001538 [Tetradesmus obliquus]WIA43666.1 hypothetical protein OEZ86_010104 [Tetradesmus obliquus]
MRAFTAFQLVACLALLGCASADDATAANYRPRAPSAWSIISANPSLSQLAGIIQRLGLQDSLNRPFSGTLLLPTNDAIDNYMAQVELLHQIDGRFSDPDTERRFWTALLEYHQLPWATGTRQSSASVTLITKHLDQGAASQAGWSQASIKHFGHNKPGTSGPSPFHKLTFMCGGARRAAAATPDAGPQTYWTQRCEVTGIRDEQGNVVTFATKNTAVMGRGVLHTVNEVLQPNDVYPSLAALLANDPDLRIIKDLIDSVNNQTRCWEGPSYLTSPDCCYCNEGYYLGQGERCFEGCFTNVSDPTVAPDCPSGGNFTCYPNGTLADRFSQIYYPFGGSFSAPLGSQGAAEVAADEAVTVTKNEIKENKAKCKDFGTCGLEGIFGTFSLPTNAAFKDWGPADSNGVPLNRDAKLWKPIVQFHFVKAKSESDFMDFIAGRGFPAENKRTNLLGKEKGDNTDKFKLSFEAPRSKLVIKYRSPNGPDETTILQPPTNIQLPPHVAHKVSSVMTPPCHPC